MTSHRQRGIGLVEVMVSLVLGLLVVGAASAIFIATRQANTTADTLSRMQESTRTAFDLMVRDVREAGGAPCDAEGGVVNRLNVAGLWARDWAQPVTGYDGAAALAGAPFGAAAGQRVNGTEAISVLYGVSGGDLTVTAHDATNAVLTTNRAPTELQVGDMALVCDTRKAALFQVSARNNTTLAHTTAGTVNTAQDLCDNLDQTALACPYTPVDPVSGTATPGAKLARLQSAAWYIGNNGRADGTGRSLYRLDGLTGTAEEIADGVTGMSITYLVRNATAYVATGAVTPWADVIAARITLTLESADARVSTAGTRLQRTMEFNVTLRNRLTS